MKKLTISTLLIALFAMPMMAQTNSVFIGATGGYNFSNFRYQDQNEDYINNPLGGVVGGATFGVRFNKWAFISGMQFNQKGANVETPTGYYNNDFNRDGEQDYGFFDIKERMNYLTVPLMLRFQLFGEESGLTLGAGVALNFGLGADISGKFQMLDFTGDSRRITSEFDVEDIWAPAVLDRGFGDSLDDEFRSMETSFILSPGFVTPVGEHGKLHFKFNLDIGMEDSYNTRYKDTFGIFGKRFNHSTSFTVSYEHHFNFEAGLKY